MTASSTASSNAAAASVLPALLFGTATFVAWHIAYVNELLPAVAALAILAAAVATSGWWQGKANRAQPSSHALTPEQSLQFIKSRRSVYPKDFSGDNSGITREKLESMLEAARWAPTHKLTEPWHFVVIGGSHKEAFEDLTIKLCQELLPPEKREQTVAKLTRKQQKDWPKVHCYIALCLKRHADAVPEWEEVCALACAVQNMALQASALGIAGYWTSWQVVARDAAEMQQLLGLDSSSGDKCLGFFVVGSADAERVQGYRPKRQPLEEKVVWML